MTLQGGRLLAVTLRPSPARRISQTPPCLLPPLARGAVEPTLWGWCEWNDIMPVRCSAQCLARRKASVMTTIRVKYRLIREQLSAFVCPALQTPREVERHLLGPSGQNKPAWGRPEGSLSPAWGCAPVTTKPPQPAVRYPMNSCDLRRGLYAAYSVAWATLGLHSELTRVPCSGFLSS